MDLYDYLCDIGVAEEIIEKMKNDKIDDSVVVLMTDAEMARYLQHKGHRVLVVDFCNRKHCKSNDNIDKMSQRKKELFAKIKTKLDLSRKSKHLKPVAAVEMITHKKVKDERKVEIGWCHYCKKEERYVQVRKATGGGTRFPCVPKLATKDVIIEEARKMFLPLAIMNVRFDLSHDVKGIHKIGNDDTVGGLYDTLKLRYIRFYLLTVDLEEESAHEYLNSTEEDNADTPILPEVMPLSDECNIICQTDSNGSDLLPTNTEDSTIIEDMNPNLDLVDYLQNECDSFNALENQSAADSQTVFYNNMGTPTVWKKSISDGLCVHQNIQDALFELSCKIEDAASERPNIVNVTRDNILDGGFRAFARKGFLSANKLNVKFAGEQGIDNGGPTREFLRLALCKIHDTMFYGPVNKKYLMLSATAVTEKKYEIAGKLMSYSIVHRGALPRFFGVTLYSVIVSGTENTNSMQIEDELIESPTREHLVSVATAESPQEFFEAVDNIITLVEVAGCAGLVIPNKRDTLVHEVKHFLIFGIMKEALEQFMVGLNHLGVLDMVRRNPECMKEAFTNNEVLNLDAARLEELFPVKEWSPVGSNRRRNEEQAISHWNDYLIDAETEDYDKLKAVLRFTTGSEEIPILGFNPCPFIGFKHREDVVGCDAAIEFPRANTCANLLLLPILNDYNTFCDRMNAAISIENFTTE